MHALDGSARHIDMPHQQIVVATLQQIHSEKSAGPRNEGATVVRHPCLPDVCMSLKCRWDQLPAMFSNRRTGCPAIVGWISRRSNPTFEWAGAVATLGGECSQFAVTDGSASGDSIIRRTIRRTAVHEPDM